MNDLTRWAIKHHVSLEALAELHDAVLGTDVTEAVVVSGIGKSEAWAQSQVRIAFSASGGRAWRNNVGALPREDGVPVRFGLANDSAAQNRVLKSGDLIVIVSGLLPLVHARFADDLAHATLAIESAQATIVRWEGYRAQA